MADIAELEMRVVDSGLGAAERNLNRVENGLTRAQSKVVTFNQALQLTQQIGRTAFDFARSMLDAAGQVEALQTRLVGLTGSEQAAAAEFEYMARLAATTPFDLKGVVEAGVTVRAFGDENRETLKAVADLAAFMGLPVAEAAAAYGRAFAGGAGAADILRERGVLALIKNREGIDDLTKLSLPQFREAMLRAMTDPDGQIAGSTDRLSKTWVGLTSNVGDAFFQLQAQLGEVVTRSSATSGGLRTLSSRIGDITEDVGEWVDANGDLIDQKIDAVFDGIDTAITGLPDLLDRVSTTGGAAAGALGDIATAVGAIASAFTSLPPGAQELLLAAIAGRVLTKSPVGAAAFAGFSGASQLAEMEAEAAGNLLKKLEELQSQMDTANADVLKGELLELAKAAGEASQTDDMRQFNAAFAEFVQKQEGPLAILISKWNELTGSVERFLGLDAETAAGAAAAGAALLDPERFGFKPKPAEAPQGTFVPPFAEVEPPFARGQSPLDDPFPSLPNVTPAFVPPKAKPKGGGGGGAGKQSELEKFAERVQEDVRTPFEAFNDFREEAQRALDAKLLNVDQFNRALELTAEKLFEGSEAAKKLKEEASGIYDETRTPAEQYDKALAKINDLLARQAISSETAHRATEQLTAAYQKDAVALRASILPAEQLADEIERINRLAAEFPEIVTEDIRTKAIEDARDAFEKLGDTATNEMEAIKSAVEGVGDAITDTIVRAVTTGEISFHDFVTAVLSDLTRLSVRELAVDPLIGFAKEGLGSLTTGLFSGGVDDGTRERLTKQGFSEEQIGKLGMGALSGLTDIPGEMSAGLKQTFAELGGDLTSLFGELSGYLSNLFNSLFGDNGFDVGEFFTTIGLAAVKSGAGAAFSGGSDTPGLEGGASMGGDYGGSLDTSQFHDGGMVGGGLRMRRDGLAPDEVPAILQEGELVIPRDDVANLFDLFSRSPEVRRYHDGGVVGSDGDDDALLQQLHGETAARRAPMQSQGAVTTEGKRPSMKVSVTFAPTIQSFDPRTSAQLLLEQAETINGIVRREVNRGARMAQDFGLRS